jgi:hypothetical protein
MLKSKGNGVFYGGWQKDWIGGWNLGKYDRFLIGNRISGDDRLNDLVIYNSKWLGVLRSTGSKVQQDSINKDWITDIPFHKYNWW